MRTPVALAVLDDRVLADGRPPFGGVAIEMHVEVDPDTVDPIYGGWDTDGWGMATTVWLLVAASTLCYLTLGCYVAVLPGYVLHHLDLSSAALGIAMGATGVVAVGLRPFSGGWGDRYGRRPIAVAGRNRPRRRLGGPGRSRAARLVILGRLLIGAGDALFITAAMAWVADAAAPERRGRAMSTIGMSLWLGLALGPQWAVWTRDHFGYNGVWLGATGFALLAAVLVWMVGPTPAPAAAEAGAARPRSCPAARSCPPSRCSSSVTATPSSRPSASST